MPWSSMGTLRLYAPSSITPYLGQAFTSHISQTITLVGASGRARVAGLGVTVGINRFFHGAAPELLDI